MWLKSTSHWVYLFSGIHAKCSLSLIWNIISDMIDGYRHETGAVYPMEYAYGCLWFALLLSMSLVASCAWWRHQMETFSALLALCARNSPVTGEFPAQRPVTRSFGVFFDLRLNKRLSKWSWGSWSQTPSRSSWRHCNDYPAISEG